MTKQEKEILIQSMKKLLDHLDEVNPNKDDIFQSLSKTDLDKIVKNIQDSNQLLRKISALFLIKILYQNEKNVIKFCEMFKIFAMKGKICLNKFPEKDLRVQQNIVDIINQLKNEEYQTKHVYEEPEFWIVNSQNKQKNKNMIEYTQLKKYKDIEQIQADFFDPADHLFGIIVSPVDKSQNFLSNEPNKTATTNTSIKKKTKSQQLKNLNSMSVSPKTGQKFIIKKSSLQDYHQNKKQNHKHQKSYNHQAMYTLPDQFYPQKDYIQSLNVVMLTEKDEVLKKALEEMPLIIPRKTGSDSKDKHKTRMEQFLSGPASTTNRNKQSIVFNHIAYQMEKERRLKTQNNNVRTRKEGSQGNTSGVTRNTNLPNNGNLFSPQYATNKLTFGSFIETPKTPKTTLQMNQNYQKIDRKNFCQIVEQIKHNVTHHKPTRNTQYLKTDTYYKEHIEYTLKPSKVNKISLQEPNPTTTNHSKTKSTQKGNPNPNDPTKRTPDQSKQLKMNKAYYQMYN